MRHFLYSFIYLTFFSFIYSNNLQFTNASIMAGESGTIDLLLDNPEDQIAGIQFQIIDYPNQGSFTDIQATDRLGDFMVELLRGGESVGQSTLTRFYSLHTFVLPWMLAVFMLMHFLMIRKQGISGPL